MYERLQALRGCPERRHVATMGIIGQVIETDMEIARQQPFLFLVWNVSYRTPAAPECRGTRWH